MSFEELRNYLERLKPFFLYSFIFFFLSILAGIIVAGLEPRSVVFLTESFSEITGPILALDDWGIFLVIFFNNSLAVFLSILLGFLLAFYPFLVLLINGFIIGILFYASQEMIETFFVAVLPHGVIELPAVFLGTAVGIMIGYLVFKNIFRKEQNPIKAEIRSGLRFFLTLLLPLLLVAAFIETWVTPAILGIS